jgi:hypothetical protein
MNDNIKKQKNKQTCHFKLCSFIGSSYYYDFDLLPSHLTILFIISRYLDMPKHQFFLKQETLAKACRMNLRTLQRACDYLIQTKLLKREKKWKLYWYELGDFFDEFSEF